MAYTQKGNPFKQTSKSQMIGMPNQSEIDLARRLNKLRFEMGHLYPIISKEEIETEKIRWVGGERSRSPREVQTLLDRTAQTEEERLELYNRDISGRGRPSPESKSAPKHITEKIRLAHDVQFIRTAKKAGGETFDKLMSLPNKDLVDFQNEVIRVAKPLIGLEISGNKETLDAINGIDLSGFKPFLEKANINTGDIRKIVDAQISNMPDENEDGTPDVFEGIKGKVIKKGVDYLINQKINQLK